MIELFNNHICNFLDQKSGFDEDDIQAIKSKYKTEITDDLSKGHITTNIGLVSGSLLGKNPREIAESIKDHLIILKEVDNVEVAGPGFLNIFIKRSYLATTVNASLKLNEKFPEVVLPIILPSR